MHVTHLTKNSFPPEIKKSSAPQQALLPAPDTQLIPRAQPRPKLAHRLQHRPRQSGRAKKAFTAAATLFPPALTACSSPTPERSRFAPARPIHYARSRRWGRPPRVKKDTHREMEAQPPP